MFDNQGFNEFWCFILADRTGLEPATSAVTGQHSNQLNYRSVFLKRSANVGSFIPSSQKIFLFLVKLIGLQFD
jgi:hypothetical protein